MSRSLLMLATSALLAACGAGGRGAPPEDFTAVRTQLDSVWVVRRDPTIGELADLPEGWIATRVSPSAGRVRSPQS